MLVDDFIKMYKELFGLSPCVIYKRLKPYINNVTGKNGFNDKTCPFCKKNIEKGSIIQEEKYVFVIKNKYPYPHTKMHLLITPKRHIRTWEELTKDELQEIQSLINKYLEKGFLLLGRHFAKHNGSTVYHLHIHLIQEEE